MFSDLVLKNRSYRRFDESVPVEEETLRELVELARKTPSSRNLQPLKFILSCDAEKNAQIFPLLKWAGGRENWDPVEGERPTAYIIVLLDKEISEDINCDHGIAAQTIMLGAVERGLGGCMLASVQRALLSEAFSIPEKYSILLVLALGKPVEEVVLEPLDADSDTKYWRTEDRVHHVPKRALEDIVLDL